MKTDWPRVSLGDVLRLERRPVVVSGHEKYEEIGIYSFGRGVFHKSPRTGFEVGEKKLFLIREGDFILQVTFAWEGAVAVASASEDGIYGSTRFPTFRVDEARCSPRFLLHYFKTEEGRRQLVKISPGSAGRNRVLSVARVPELQVPLPPLMEQRRVVAQLEALAASIEEISSLHQQATDGVEALVSSYVSALAYSQATTERTVADILGESKLKNGKSLRSFEDVSEVQCLSVSAIRNGRVNVVDSKPVSMTPDEAAPFRVRRGDVFIVRGNGSKHLCGRAGLVVEEQGSLIFPDLFIRVPLECETIVPEYFVAVWNSAAIRRVIEEKARTTSGIWKINQGHILSIKIPVPLLAEQLRIAAQLQALQAKVGELKRLQAETAAELDALLPSILDKAFKGEL